VVPLPATPRCVPGLRARCRDRRPAASCDRKDRTESWASLCAMSSNESGRSYCRRKDS
jgi:hypothetical protein